MWLILGHIALLVYFGGVGFMIWNWRTPLWHRTLVALMWPVVIPIFIWAHIEKARNNIR